MKVHIDTERINLKFIKEALEFAKTLEVVPDRLSTIEIQDGKETIRYNLWHNKKSIVINSQQWDTKSKGLN